MIAVLLLYEVSRAAKLSFDINRAAAFNTLIDIYPKAD
jgi:hypothetical protein